MSRTIRYGAAVAVSALMLAAGAPVLAQSQPQAQASQEQVSQVGDIIVTAQRRAENVQDVPISIVVLSGEKLDQAGVTDFADLVALTPGLIADSNSDPRSSRIGLRGVTSSQENGKQSSVGVFIDGVFMSRAGMAFAELQDVERVEVLRGPQGTLFGMNTAAGLVHIITSKPNFNRTSGFVEGVIGDHDRRDLRGLVTGPLGDSGWAYSLSGFWTERGGLVHNATLNRDVNDVSRHGLRAKLAYNGERFDVQFIADMQNDESDCCVSVPWRFRPGASLLGTPAAPLLPAGYPYSRTSVSPFAPRTESESRGFSAEANWSLSDSLTLTSVTGWRSWDLYTELDPGALPVPLVNTFGWQDHTQFSQELRLSSDDGGRVTWVAGLFYFDRATDHVGQLHYKPAFLSGPGQTGITTTDFTLDDTTYAVFAQASFHVTDALTLTAGARYTQEKQDATQRQVASNVVDPNYNRADSRDEGQLTWTFNATYDVSPDVMVYASVARGFKPGGFDLGRPATFTEFQFEEETNINTEIGVRSQFYDRKLTLNATAFNTVYENFQTLAFDGLRFLSLNAPEFVTRGVEIEALARPITGLTLTAQASFIDAEYTDFVNGACPAGVAGACDLTGRRLHQSPRTTATITASYDWPVFSGWNAFVYGDYAYRSGVYSNQALDPMLFQEGYGLVGLRFGLKSDDGLMIEAWSTNLFDKDYMVFGFNSPLLTGGYSGFVGDPRMAGVRIRRSF